MHIMILSLKKQDKRLPDNKAKGFTLIEVLVSMLILAIGLLGIAALQFKGLKYSNDASIRSNISMLAYDIADRIRLNKAKASDYLGTYTVPTTAPSACNQATGANAANDLACWRREVFDLTPPGSSADITSAAGQYTITLAWTDREGDSHNVVYTFQP